MNELFEMKPASVNSRKTYMLLDLSNHMHRNRHGAIRGGGSDDDINEYAIHLAIQSLNKLYNDIRPTKIVACADHKSWRKEIFPMYKARRHDARKEDAGFDKFIEMSNEFKALITEYSSIIYLEQRRVEADDWIARWIQTHPDDVHVIVSSDGDFHQLHAENVTQYNPVHKKWVEVDDPKFAIFLKCIRGETAITSDNIPSAYPKIRKTKLEKAFYGDEFLMETIMQHKVPNVANLDDDGVPVMATVRELFDRNTHLMDLSKQPDDIVEIMDDVIADAEDYTGKFNNFAMLKYLARNNLIRIANDIDRYVPMLTL